MQYLPSFVYAFLSLIYSGAAGWERDEEQAAEKANAERVVEQPGPPEGVGEGAEDAEELEEGPRERWGWGLSPWLAVRERLGWGKRAKPRGEARDRRRGKARRSLGGGGPYLRRRRAPLRRLRSVGRSGTGWSERVGKFFSFDHAILLLPF